MSRLVFIRLLRRTAAIGLTSTMFLPGRHSRSEIKTQTITVHARRYEFIPSEITLRRDARVKLVFISDDVDHGIVVEGLGLDVNIDRKHPGAVTLVPSQAGDFYGVCSKYCGAGHRDMKFVVHVKS